MTESTVPDRTEAPVNGRRRNGTRTAPAVIPWDAPDIGVPGIPAEYLAPPHTPAEYLAPPHTPADYGRAPHVAQEPTPPSPHAWRDRPVGRPHDGGYLVPAAGQHRAPLADVLPMPEVAPTPPPPTNLPTMPLPPPAPSGRAAAGNAAELSHDMIVRRPQEHTARGWRRVLFTVSAGRVNPGLGPVEQARQELLRRIRRPLPVPHQIAVTSIKGGVGKTTVAACLGLMLADHRGDRVVALDANPDAGTLADRLTGKISVTVRQLLDHAGSISSITDVARFTSVAGRLHVLASEQDPAMSEAFHRAEYELVCEVLTRFHNIVITDSGTGLVHSAMDGTLGLADSLVIVGTPTVDGASRASKTLDWLVAHGHEERAGDAVMVFCCDRSSPDVDQHRIHSHFATRCRAVIDIPFDPHLAAGGRIRLADLDQGAHDGYLELAAAVADQFGRERSRTPGRPGKGGRT